VARSSDPSARDGQVVAAMAVALLAAAWLHLLAGVASGIADAVNRREEYGIGVLLAVLAAVAVWVRLRGAAGGGEVGGSEAGGSEALRSMTVLLLALTAVAGVVSAVGYALVFGHADTGWSAVFGSVGSALADVVVAVVLLVGFRRMTGSAYRPVADGGDADGDDVLFAVDRGTGDVRAFFSYAEAARRMHVYSIEDDEYQFFTDAGVPVTAVAERGEVEFRPGSGDRSEELMAHLREFAERRGIAVDPADEAWAYAEPISRWQWLELWPGWLRWMGHLVRW
jgi:hypothetical protein